MEELRLNPTISPETRQLIENMFSRPRMGQEVAEAADAANRIGTTFREISLRRFVIEGTSSDEDRRNQELIVAEQSRDLLLRIVELGEAGQLLQAAGVPLVIPY